MLSRSTRRFFNYFAGAYPGRTILMILLFVGAGFAEAIGIAGLLPVLEIGIGGASETRSGFSDSVAELLSRVGLPATLPVLLAVVVLAISVKGALKWLAMREAGFVTARVGMDLRLRLIRSLMEAKWSFFMSQPAGNFSNAISSEAHRAAMGYREACAALANLIQVVVYFLFAVLISWKIALAAIVAGGCILFFLRGFVERARRAGIEQAQTMRSLVARLTEALPGIKPVKAMAREPFVLPLLEQETHGYNRAQRRQVTAVETMFAFQEPALVAILAVGLYSVITFASTPFANILVLAFLFNRLVGGLNRTQQLYQSMTTGEGAFLSIESLISDSDSAREIFGGVLTPPDRLKQGIDFNGVSLAYDQQLVLKNVDVLLPAGHFVALVGPSGSGKTTIADLVVGLLQPTEGEVRVDEVRLADLDAKAWRRGIGYVPQDLLLFHDSIRRNVTLGNDSIPDSEVERALRAAGAWTFVKELPDGLDQQVGERGAKLSGGQRQRIAIARALVERPRLLILDEPTTALDPVTEAEICRTLVDLKPEITILAISHQAAMREVADIVYEVRNQSVHKLVDRRSFESV